MCKQITFKMDLTDAIMLMACMQGFVQEAEENGRVQTPGDLLVLNPIKRTHREMITQVRDQATIAEIRAANKEADELYID
jgi:hypothetical protein